jgi:hypothetical protein
MVGHASGTNYGDVSMTNLPEQILINAGATRLGPFFMTQGK